MADDGKVNFSVAMEIIDVITKFEYTESYGRMDRYTLERAKLDIAHSIILYLSGRAENIYPVEPGIHTPGEVQKINRRRFPFLHEGRGEDDDVRER